MSDDRSRGRRGGEGRHREHPKRREQRAARGRGTGLPYRPASRKRGGDSARTIGRVERPRWPEGQEVDLPKGVVKELERHATSEAHARQLALALSAASEAVAEGAVEAAGAFTAWLRQEVPRSAAVRETAAIVAYQGGDYRTALRDLQTYQRLTGRKDQNHLVADCHRALGHPVDQVADAVTAMEDSFPDRYVEGLLVWASTLADRGEPGAGAALLRRSLEADLLRRAGSDAAARAAYVQGDLAERSGRLDEAAAAFGRSVELAGGEAWDASERRDAARRAGRQA